MRKTLFITTLLLILLLTGQATAKEWPAQTNVQINKTWAIWFNKSADVLTLNNGTIYIADSDGNIFPTELSIANDHKSVLISPYRTTNYAYGKTYRLVVTNYITSNNKTLNESSTLTFTTVSK